jgi:hypothetical protein
MRSIIWRGGPLITANLVLAACGGGSGNGGGSGAPQPDVQSVGGLWQGQFATASGASIEGSALIGENGTFFSQVDDPSARCDNVMTGTLTVSGSTVSGTVVLALLSDTVPEVSAPACVFSDGATTASGTVSGTVSQRSTLTLTPKLATSNGTALSVTTLQLRYDSAIYDAAPSLATIAGTYQGPTGAVTSISAGGAISVGYPNGCTISGTISVINSKYDAYGVSGSYAGCPSDEAMYNGATVVGILDAIGTAGSSPLFGGYSVSIGGHVTNAIGVGSVLAPPSGLSYPGNAVFTIGQSGSSLTPSLNGTANVWSVTPALPAGLTLDPVSGIISGTATVLSPTTAYTVTAKNGAGDSTATIHITVQEISAVVGQEGETGQVQVAVEPFSEYGITSVSGTLDGQLLGTLTAPNGCSLPGQRVPVCTGNDYGFTLNAATLGSGTHTLVYTITDAKGVVDKVTQSITINNPPVVSFIPGDGAIAFGTLSISGTATTDKQGVGITTTATFDGAQIFSTTSGSFAANYSASTFPPGNYQLVVRSTDSTGAVTTVNETITLASAANLVYTPVATLGPGSTLLAVDPTTAVYGPLTGASSNYYMLSGSHKVTLQQISSDGGWMVSNGVPYASGNAGDRPAGDESVYTWNAAGEITNLSTAGQSTGILDTVSAAHGGWVLWTSGLTELELYNPSSNQKYLIPLPTGTSSISGGDFYVSGSGPVAYFSAGIGSSSEPSAVSIYQWTAVSGVSTLIFANGEYNVSVQTDGVRVAWQTIPPLLDCIDGQACTLTSFDIASATTQSVSSDIQYPGFFLADGVLAWYESSSSMVGGIKDSTGTNATVQVPSAAASAQLLGTGGGYVLYLDLNKKLYAWNTATASAQLLFDASPVTAKISGKTVWFTNGNTQALYQIALP